jgi:superoxide dismutase, Cu-Zn family
MRGTGFTGIALAVAFGLPSTAVAQTSSATASFVNAAGMPIGRATLSQTPHGVLIRIDVEELPPGEHGFHVHQTGICELGDKFMSAGGHFAPAERKHGYKTEGGPHAGDMPNLFVASDGTLTAEIVNPRVTLDGGQASVFDQDGSALVIHAKPDDYASQPAGNAGDRIACAVIRR